MALGRVEDAIAAIRAGEAVIVVDDEDRETRAILLWLRRALLLKLLRFPGPHVGDHLRCYGG
jgi:3,4-dihydroxy-2-butanone 4-phosphate synthase